MKLCKDCKWDIGGISCNRIEKKEIKAGAIIKIYFQKTERKFLSGLFGGCGPEAKFWEAKEVTQKGCKE